MYMYTYICILPSKTQHMYINTVMKYQLHLGYMFRPDGRFTAETCSPDVIDISQLC